MRLFVGLALPQTVRVGLGGLCHGVVGARWVAVEAMHMTLRFIGEVDRTEAADIDLALAGIRAPAFDLSLSGLGCFMARSKVRALWAGVVADEVLLRLQAKVESAVVRAGQPPEGHKFKPHVTLARFKPSAGAQVGPFIEANNDFPRLDFSVNDFTLFESRLGHGGAHYLRLADYPLIQIAED